MNSRARALSLAACIVSVLSASNASAQLTPPRLHVTSCRSSGPGSLLDLANSAASGSVIVFDLDCISSAPPPVLNAKDTSTIIQLYNTIVVNGRELTIDGAGHRIILNSDRSPRRFFTVGPNGTLKLAHLFMSNGVGVADGAPDRLRSASVPLATTLGGAIRVMRGGKLEMDHSAIMSSFADEGGAIFNEGITRVTDSEITLSAAIGGGAISNSGELIVSGTTITDNVGRLVAGGILNYGTANISNSTIALNRADRGGGILNESSMTLRHVTVSENVAASANHRGAGSGITNAGGILRIGNSIVSGNQYPGGSAFQPGADCDFSRGKLVDEGDNLSFGDVYGTTCTFSVRAINQDPMLEPLNAIVKTVLEDGPTRTMALRVGSAANGTGNVQVCERVGGKDQRGNDRMANGRMHCDVGAYDTGSGTFENRLTVSTVTVVCDTIVQPNTGEPHTPCTASVSAQDMQPVDITDSIVYLNNINEGGASATAKWPGDDKHTWSVGGAYFRIGAKALAVTNTNACAAGCYTAHGTNDEIAFTLTGNAAVDDDDGERFELVLGENGLDGTYIAFAREPGGPPAKGTYQLAEQCADVAPETNDKRFTAEFVMHAGAENLATFVSAGGSLTINRTETRMTGQYDFSACRFDAGGERHNVRVRGTFDVPYKP